MPMPMCALHMSMPMPCACLREQRDRADDECGLGLGRREAHRVDVVRSLLVRQRGEELLAARRHRLGRVRVAEDQRTHLYCLAQPPVESQGHACASSGDG